MAGWSSTMSTDICRSDPVSRVGLLEGWFAFVFFMFFSCSVPRGSFTLFQDCSPFATLLELSWGSLRDILDSLGTLMGYGGPSRKKLCLCVLVDFSRCIICSPSILLALWKLFWAILWILCSSFTLFPDGFTLLRDCSLSFRHFPVPVVQVPESACSRANVRCVAGAPRRG